MFLALDVGTKTIGVATSSGAMPVATAWFTLRREGVKKDVSRLVSAVEGEAWSVDQVVVGLPLEMDDAERRICRLARQVGDRLAAETGWPVHYQDERWTTIEARRRLERDHFEDERHQGDEAAHGGREPVRQRVPPPDLAPVGEPCDLTERALRRRALKEPAVGDEAHLRRAVKVGRSVE